MIPWDLIIKDFKLEITEEEHKLLNDWLLESSSKRLYELLQNLWYLILKQRIKAEESDNNTDELWNKLSARINSNKFERSKKYLSNSRHLWWIAALILLFITVGSTWYICNNVINKNMVGLEHTYETYSGKSRIILPDSTVVWLKNDTKLSYGIKRTHHHKERYAKLDGEAFFNVTQNKKLPFIVDVKNVKIKVFGTSFNVKSFKTKDDIELFLVNGVVTIIKDSVKKTLKPGELAIYFGQSNTITTLPVDVDLESSWAQEKLRIENMPFSQVVKLLERWFDINIEIDDTIPDNQLYTFTLRDESLTDVLDLMSQINPIQYRFGKNNVIIINQRK